MSRERDGKKSAQHDKPTPDDLAGIFRLVQDRMMGIGMVCRGLNDDLTPLIFRAFRLTESIAPPPRAASDCTKAPVPTVMRREAAGPARAQTCNWSSSETASGFAHCWVARLFLIQRTGASR